MDNEQHPSAATSSRRPRLWPWGVGGILVGIIASIAFLNWWNSRLALTAQRLTAAKQRWQQHGPQDYDLEVRVTGATQACYQLQVRGGKVVSATRDGQPFENFALAYPWTVPGIFEIVLEQDLQRQSDRNQPPVYCQLEFDPELGYPKRYLRSSDKHTVQMELLLTVRR